jgi:hypothetical protein
MAEPKKLTHRDLIALLAKGVHDPAFRARLTADPAATLAAEGFASDPQTLRFFESVTKGQSDDAGRRATEHHAQDAIKFAGDM